MAKGTIAKLYTISCGICGTIETLHSPRRSLVEKEARKQGWLKNYNNGWVCRSCKKGVK